MDELKKNYKLIIVCLIIIISIPVIYLVFNYNDSLEKASVSDDKKTYDAQEYLPILVKEEDVVKIYMNEYKNNMIFDSNEAYNSLNKEYRDKKFGSYEKYKEYLDEFISDSTYSLEVDSYSVNNINGFKVFNIYDKDGNQYIFKEISIMNYEVYLDPYSVEIK